MKLFGLTGGIGAGKSTAAEILARHGVPVVDTDQLARDIVEPGQPALEAVVREFGHNILDQHGRVRRDLLAQIVFGDAARRQALEAILHPRIRDLWQLKVQSWRAASHVAGVVVIPLLFETSAQGHFNAIISIACSAESQRDRLRARRWSSDEIEKRLAAQWPLERKMAASDYVIWSEGSIHIHEQQLKLVFGW